MGMFVGDFEIRGDYFVEVVAKEERFGILIDGT